MTNADHGTFSAFERMQRMKKGSALFRVSNSFVREVCRKHGKRMDKHLAAADACKPCVEFKVKQPETEH